MKTRFYIATVVLVLALTAVGFADQAADDYDKLMKPAIAANMKTQMSVKTDLAAAAASAGDEKAAFAAIEQYWTMHGAPDAATFAKNIETAAGDVQTAAAAGNMDAAVAAAAKIAPNCGGCHMGHRTRNADGTFSIK